MMFLELFVPRGAFGPDELQRLAERLTMKQLLTHVDAIRDVVGASEASSANAGVVDFLDSINHVVVHEIGTWIVGGRRRAPGAPPRYVARVFVPGPWRKAMSAFLIASITRALCLADTDPERAYREPNVEVHVIGVPEGGYGVFGRVTGESALLELISQAKTEQPASGGLVDPVCGMVATDMVDVLEHEGTVYGFCSPGCRRHFVDKLAQEQASR
jgi:YHS domain-containing protein